MSHLNGEQFLHKRDPRLHSGREVEDTVSYLRTSGEKIPNDPARKIGAYVSFLAHEQIVNDGLLTGDSESIERQIEHEIIKPEDVPEIYFDLQKRIAREQGNGTIELSDGQKHAWIDTLREEQAASLRLWATYLTDKSSQATYPDWFKRYTWDGLLKLGQFDKQKGEFKKRAKTTVTPYADLNAEALAYVYEVLEDSLKKEPYIGGEAIELAKAGNFASLYAHAVLEVTPASAERREITDGNWKKYDQINGDYDPYYQEDANGEYHDNTPVDNETAMLLAKSLQGHGTGWCTAGTRTAANQLSMGDFYVYYSQDENGNDSVPRVAIRMEYGEVVEVRGINHAQALEENMIDIASQKLQMLDGGEEYFDKLEKLKRMTEIDKIVQNGGELSIDDLAFFYTQEVEGLGYDLDPRFEEILLGRNEESDLKRLCEAFGVDVIIKRLLECKRDFFVVSFFKVFDQASQESLNAVVASLGGKVFRFPDIMKRAGVDPVRLFIENREILQEDVDNSFRPLHAAGVPIDKISWMMSSQGRYEHAKELRELGASIIVIEEYSQQDLREFFHPEDFDALFSRGIDPTALALIPSEQNLLYWYKQYEAAGAEIDYELVAATRSREGSKSLQEYEVQILLEKGVPVDQVVRGLKPYVTVGLYATMQEHGAGINVDMLLSSLHWTQLVENFQIAERGGITREKLLEHIDAGLKNDNNVRNDDELCDAYARKLISYGVDADWVTTHMISSNS